MDTTITYIEQVECRARVYQFYFGNNWLFNTVKIVQAEGKTPHQ